MLKFLKKMAVIFADPKFWTCARCGTTNESYKMICTQCKNRRPW